MSGTRAAVLISGIAGVSAVAVAAVCMGYNGMIITGAMTAITGITGVTVAYYKGREVERQRRGQDGNTKTDRSGAA